MTTEAGTRLGEELVASGVLAPEKLRAGLAFQRTEGGQLADILVLHGLAGETELLRHIAGRLGAKFLTSDRLAKSKLDADVLDKIAVRECERLVVLPLAFDAEAAALTVAVPELEPALITEVRRASGVPSVVPIIALRMTIRAGIQRFYYSDQYAFASMSPGAPVAKITTDSVASVLARVDTTQVRVLPSPSSSVLPVAKPGGTAIFGVPPEPVRTEVVVEPAGAAAPLAAPAGDRDTDRRALVLLAAANELEPSLAKETNLTGVLHRSLAYAFDRLPADDGAVLYADEPGGPLTPRAVRTRRQEDSEVHVAEALVSEVRRARQGVLTSDAVYDPRFRKSESVANTRLRSAMGVPLVIAGEVRGVMALAKRDPTVPFTPTDLDLFSAIAGTTAAAIEQIASQRQHQEDAVERARYARFLPPALADLAASGALQVDEAGQLTEATLVVAEIRNFAALAERLGPREVVAALNEHLESMLDVVFAQAGVLDRFTGGGLVALWGAPARRDDDVERALRAALEMASRVKEANAWKAEHGGPQFDFAVGVATGMVVYGAVGAGPRIDLMAIGEAASTAARLCESAASGEVVASDTTAMAAGTAFATRALSAGRLKGKGKLAQAFVVTGEGRGRK